MEVFVTFKVYVFAIVTLVTELVGLLPPGDHEKVTPDELELPFSVTVGEEQVIVLLGPALAFGSATEVMFIVLVPHPFEAVTVKIPA